MKDIWNEDLEPIAQASFECEDCLGMPEHGCYCLAVGAVAPGGPIARKARDDIAPCCSCVQWCGRIVDCVGLSVPDFLLRHKPKKEEPIEW